MQLSKRTQYGLQAMICLADSYDRGYLQTKELAAREGLPTKFLESILSALTRGKFLTSKIGATGGYRLARHPKDLLLSDIIGRLEGRKLLDDDNSASEDERPGEVAFRLVQAELSVAIRDVLTNMTLQALVEKVALRTRGDQMYYI